MTAKSPADRSRAFRLAGALVGACRWRLAAASTTDERRRPASIPGRLPPAPSDRDPGSRTARSSSSSATAAAACPPPQRADVIGLAQTWLREGTGGDHHRRAGRHAERARRRRYVARNPVDAGRRRRAAARHRRAATITRADPAHAGDDPAQLSEDRGGRRALRPVAGRPRPVDQQQELLREQAVLQFRLRLSAQPRGDGRQSGRPRAAARRNAGLHGAPHRRPSRSIARATPTATTYPEADKAKLSDTGK